MSRRVRVHAFLAAATVSQSGLHPTSNLLGVDYWHEVPADVEFPRMIGRLDLFTRFYLRNARPTEFLVAIRWLDSSTRQGRRPVRFGPFTVNFQPNEFVRDHSFRVINIRLGGCRSVFHPLGARSKTKLEGASVRSARRNATVRAEVVMGRRNRQWDPPLGGQCPNLGPQMSESISDDEKAGKPMPPAVELRPCGPPLEITEAGPLPLPPESLPFDRAAVLAGLQMAFAQLTDDELEVARMRMLGVPYVEISEELGMLDEEVEKLWKQARRKLGTALFGTPTAVRAEPSSESPGLVPRVDELQRSASRPVATKPTRSGTEGHENVDSVETEQTIKRENNTIQRSDNSFPADAVGQRVWEEILALPVQLREVMLLVLSDLSSGNQIVISKIAASLNIPFATCYDRLAKALERLGSVIDNTEIALRLESTLATGR